MRLARRGLATFAGAAVTGVLHALWHRHGTRLPTVLRNALAIAADAFLMAAPVLLLVPVAAGSLAQCGAVVGAGLAIGRLLHGHTEARRSRVHRSR